MATLQAMYEANRRQQTGKPTGTGAVSVSTRLGTVTVKAVRKDGALTGFSLSGFGKPRFVTTGLMAAVLLEAKAVEAACTASADATAGK